MELETRQPEAEALTQQDVERLVEEVVQAERQSVILRVGGTREECPRDRLQPHDFRAPCFLSASQWRKLRSDHESFALALSARLSNYLRMEVGLRVTRLETQSYRDFLGDRAEPTHLTIFRLEPLRGMCLVEIHPHLGLSMVDRLLGGPGKASSVSRDLSEIEVALLDQALLMMLNEWCQRWQKLQELRPAILGHESTGRYLQTAPPAAPMLVLALEVRLGQCTEELTMAFPCTTLEPLLRQMMPVLTPGATESPRPPAAAPAKWNHNLDSITVPLAAEWPDRQVTARQVAGLKVGDVLEWDPAAANQVRLCLAQTAKFIGRLGTKNGRWAVEITAPAPAAPV